MRRTKARLWLCGILLTAILAFIWGNSAMPGEESGALSGWVAEFLQSLLPFLDFESGIGMHLLRKAAHFSEFCLLGICLCWLFGMLVQKRWTGFLLPLGSGILAACIDETIQIFSPGRHSSIVDVTIDSAGVLTGVLLLIFCCYIYKTKMAATKA